jgi:hypothetical protein
MVKHCGQQAAFTRFAVSMGSDGVKEDHASTGTGLNPVPAIAFWKCRTNRDLPTPASPIIATQLRDAVLV